MNQDFLDWKQFRRLHKSCTKLYTFSIVNFESIVTFRVKICNMQENSNCNKTVLRVDNLPVFQLTGKYSENMTFMWIRRMWIKNVFTYKRKWKN